MYVESEGICLRQSKSVNGRQMVTIFTKKFGKISVGANVSAKAKSKGNMALKPFVYGRYSLYKKKDNYNLNGGETIRSHYRIGEDIDKYMVCSYILELTDKVLMDNEPNPRLFNLLMDFLQEIEARNSDYMTLVVAYEMKLLNILGIKPLISQCVGCNRTDNVGFFSVSEGGVLCEDCGQQVVNSGGQSLIFPMNFVMINIMEFLEQKPLAYFRKLSLKEDALIEIRKILKEYIKFHLDISKIKSEDFLNLG